MKEHSNSRRETNASERDSREPTAYLDRRESYALTVCLRMTGSNNNLETHNLLVNGLMRLHTKNKQGPLTEFRLNA